MGKTLTKWHANGQSAKMKGQCVSHTSLSCRWWMAHTIGMPVSQLVVSTNWTSQRVTPVKSVARWSIGIPIDNWLIGHNIYKELQTGTCSVCLLYVYLTSELSECMRVVNPSSGKGSELHVPVLSVTTYLPVSGPWVRGSLARKMPAMFIAHQSSTVSRIW